MRAGSSWELMKNGEGRLIPLALGDCRGNSETLLSSKDSTAGLLTSNGESSRCSDIALEV